MRVYGYFYDEEQNLNYGVHEVDEEGKSFCIQKQAPIAFKRATNQEDLLDAEAIERFRVDIDEVGLIIAVKDEDTILRYIDNLDEGVNAHKVYYYGKDLIQCFECQDRALDCLEYIAYQHEQHKDFAYNFVYRYLELRENPEADIEQLLRDARGQRMIDIQNSI